MVNPMLRLTSARVGTSIYAAPTKSSYIFCEGIVLQILLVKGDNLCGFKKKSVSVIVIAVLDTVGECLELMFGRLLIQIHLLGT